MSDTIRTALIFLIDTIFNLYLFVLIIRIILVWVKSDYFNPISHFVVKLTSPVVNPLRKVIPNINNIEVVSIVLVMVIETIKFFLVACISFGFPNLLGIPILAIADAISLTLQVFTYAIILQIILSFVQPFSPLRGVVSRFTSPVMNPIQRLIPPVGGFDLSPIPALIVLQLLSILLVSPLMALGQSISFG